MKITMVHKSREWELWRPTCWFYFLLIPSVFFPGIESTASRNNNNNLTCYQCQRNTESECAPEDLLPCPSVSDICVTHISKNEDDGFSIKRECGLGPCSFNDNMADRGLGGGFGNCDRNKNEYFCIFCCQQSGCNKSTAGSIIITTTSTTTSVMFLIMTISVVVGHLLTK